MLTGTQTIGAGAMAVALLAAACGGSDPETSSDAATAVTVAETTTSSVAVPASVAPEPEIRPFGERTLTPRRYRTTSTDPICTFEVSEHGEEIRWFGRLQTPWSINVILFSDLTPEVGHEPGVAIAVAEAGSTVTHELRANGLAARAGVHTGEVELRGNDIGGIAVHIAARIASLANDGEVLVSRTIQDLTAGSGISFQPRGTHELRGIPDRWELLATQTEHTSPG